MARTIASIAAIGAGAVAFLLMSTPAFAQNVAQISQDMAVALPFTSLSIKARTLLVGLHLLGLCLGVGGVIVLDALLAKAIIRGVFYSHNRALVRILSKTTGAGLMILWVSGLCILLLYRHDHPELLNNPKIYAKVIIVAALTVNGWLVERFCEPLSEIQGDAPLLVSYTPAMQLLGVFCGVFSAVSWYTASVLGVFRELNNVVPASTILAVWAAVIAVSFASATILGLVLKHANGGSAAIGRSGLSRETVSFDVIRGRLPGVSVRART